LGSTSSRKRFRNAARLADWELAELWYLPDASFDRAGFERDRPLAAPPPTNGSGELGLVVAEARGRPLAIPTRILPRHVVALGATGSGKSTLLLNLALAAIEADIGTTVIDPHGDLVNDVLSRVPRSAAGRVHVLRLADRAHPRGFNFLERRGPGDDVEDRLDRRVALALAARRPLLLPEGANHRVAQLLDEPSAEAVVGQNADQLEDRLRPLVGEEGEQAVAEVVLHLRAAEARPQVLEHVHAPRELRVGGRRARFRKV
jgi:DNA helicase HerA-like ATPase